MRVLAWGGVAGPLLFASVVVVCAALRPGYSHVDRFISELGATGSPHAGLMNYAGFIPGGLLVMGLAASIRARLPRQLLATLGALLVLLFGAGIALSGVFSCDVGCPRTGGSLENLIHDRLAPVTFLSASFGAICVGLCFRGLRPLRSLWVYSIGSGLSGLALLAMVVSTLESRELVGLWQRLMLAVLFAWCAVVGVRLAAGGGARDPERG